MILYAILVSFAVGVLVGAVAMHDIQKHGGPTKTVIPVNGHRVVEDGRGYVCKGCDMEAPQLHDYESLTDCPGT